MKRLQQGFTLIELMIVVAIVGILAAIALPAYQDYVIRSKMSEGVVALAACKTSIAEYVSTKTTMPADADRRLLASGDPVRCVADFRRRRYDYRDDPKYGIEDAVACVLTLDGRARCVASGYSDVDRFAYWLATRSTCRRTSANRISFH